MEFFDDPTLFLAAAGDFLAADPITFSVLATQATRAAAAEPEPEPVDWPRWYAVVRDEGPIVGVAMRTHPGERHPVWIGPMPLAAAKALAAVLTDRGEEVPSANGALPAVEHFADAAAEGMGGQATHDLPMRLWALETVRWPAKPVGALREATVEDVDDLLPLLAGFMGEAADQAGRSLRPTRLVATTDEVRGHFAAGRRYLIWEVEGQIAHLTGINVPAFGTVRIGLVLTPKPFRGKGIAAYVVAIASQMILDEGLRPCLYTDVTNPVSNGVYERIGYEPWGDSAEFTITASQGGRGSACRSTVRAHDE